MRRVNFQKRITHGGEHLKLSHGPFILKRIPDQTFNLQCKDISSCRYLLFCLLINVHLHIHIICFQFPCSFAYLLRQFSSSASIFEHFSPLLAWLPEEESKAAKLGDPEAKFEFHCGFSAKEMTLSVQILFPGTRMV